MSSILGGGKSNRGLRVSRRHPRLKKFGSGAATFLDSDTSGSSLAFDIEINRGDLRQLAPRKKLLKSCVGLLESLRAFRFLT